MILAQAYETNLDRLRRYAAFSCGSEGVGDGVVSEALEDMLSRVSSAENANRVGLFQRLDAALRKTPHGEGDVFDELGRWRELSPLERRVIMLYVLEEFTVRDVVQITGLVRGEVKAIIARARMVYADRFPVRIGLVGGDAGLREAIEAALTSVGHRLLWAVTPEAAADPAALPPASLVVIAHDGDAPKDAANFCSGHARPVILAFDGAIEDRLSSRCWTMPLDGLADATLFNSTLVRALLFSS
nr:hypothetical protein [uncultured Hyphomonas sp.]